MRIPAACAALGAAVGGLLVVVLRFAAGPRVLDGVSERGGDPFLVGSSIDVARVLPVALGAGLVGGLLVGVVLQWVTGRRRPAAGRRAVGAALAVCGGVLGVGVATELHAYGQRATPGSAFGWYAYSPLSASADGILYGGGLPSAWWPLALTGAATGLAVGAAAGTLWFVRRPAVRASTSPIG